MKSSRGKTPIRMALFLKSFFGLSLSCPWVFGIDSHATYQYRMRIRIFTQETISPFRKGGLGGFDFLLLSHCEKSNHFFGWTT